MKICEEAEQTVGLQEHGSPERRKIPTIPNQLERWAIRHVSYYLGGSFLEHPDWADYGGKILWSLFKGSIFN